MLSAAIVPCPRRLKEVIRAALRGDRISCLRLHARAAAQLQFRIDSAPQLSIERVSSSTNALVFCEILLAAFLIMCNAAENFLPLR